MPNQGNDTHHIISHNPATHTVQPHHSNHSQQAHPPRYHRSKKPKIPTIILSALGIALIVVGIAWYMNGQSFNFTRQSQIGAAFTPIDETVVATVGVEDIYAEDIKYELSFYPESQHEEIKQGINERLIKESIILQAGAEEGIIQLSGEVFGNVHKDREKRRALAATVEETINAKAAHKKGSIISVWFMNFQPGPLGYEAGKAFALEKITAAHQAVQTGQMTAKQAGEMLSKDTSLAQIDAAYDSNSYLEFDTRDTTEVTFFSDFNEQLLALEPGQTTAIYTGQDFERDYWDQPKKDALYMFGHVTESKVEGDLPFEAWLEEKRNDYEIIKY